MISYKNCDKIISRKKVILLYRIAVCDDDVLYLDNISDKVNLLFKKLSQPIYIDKFIDTEDLLKAIKAGADYKLIFLDILFPNSNGVDIAKKIKSISPHTYFIFLSTTSDYALESFDVAPIYYITKPEDDKKLEEAVKRFLCNNSINKITIKTSNNVVSLDIDSIIYFEIMGHNILMHTTDNKYNLKGTLKEIEDIIPTTNFARVHKSYIVNFKYITKIERYKITLHTDFTIPISKLKYSELQNQFIEYASKKAIVF